MGTTPSYPMRPRREVKPNRDFHRWITIAFDATSVDLEIKWSAETATVADLLAAASAEVGTPQRNETHVVLNGRWLRSTTPLERAGLVSGSIIECGSAAPPVSAIAAAPPTAREVDQTSLDHIAGSDAGARIPVPEGWGVELRSRQGQTIAATISSTGDEEARWYWRPGDHIEVGAEVVAVARRPPWGTRSERRVPPDGQPTILYRPPRVVAADQVEAPARPELPAQPADPPPLSWASLLAPIPIGITMALLFRPYFLLFTAAGPVLFLGRWWEGKRRHRRACVEWQRELYDRSVEYHQRLETMAKIAADERRRRHPNICEILERVDHGDRTLWERRPTHEDFAQATVGYGAREWNAPDAGPDPRGERARSPDMLLGKAAPKSPTMLKTVPLVVDLRRHRIVGVVGSAAAQNLVRALFCQLAALHGPAHVRIGHGADPSGSWQWLKWLPHYLSTDDDLVANQTPGDETSGEPWIVRVAPAIASTPTSSIPTGIAANGFGSWVIIAGSPDDLPTQCSLLIDCRSYDAGSSRPELVLTDVEAGTTAKANNLIGVNGERAEHLARRLAGFVDPEIANSAAALPTIIALADLEAWHSEGPILEAWQRDHGDGLKAVIGAAGQSYAIDLVQDGPHALVAGTTGSGKSELLRTWVAALAGRYAPRDCAFVLIDFKGGGAFDAVASLPHVAAVVTDLDEGLAQRGLRSLRAELRDREHRLREREVADIETYRKRGYRDLPRLVLIIDEFATLAAELPAFLDGLVDIAQRGRSLGVHMVLATQRPAGVLDQKIRANTNLRICLRVQDSADSIDVIDVRDAALLPRNRPGRALIRKGADELRTVQCAHIGPSESRPNEGLRHRRFDPGTSRSWQPPSAPQPGAIDRILAAARIAEGTDLVTVPNAPWCAPLPAELARADLWADDAPHSAAVPIGVEDRPDERVQKVWYWDRSAGPLLVVGGTDGERRAIIASVIDGVGRAAPETDTYVIHTEIGATPFGVAGWPGAIAADDIESIDRILLRSAQASPNSRPLVVIVERFDLIGAGATESDAAIVREHLERVIARSARSVSVVIGGATERSIPSRIAAYAGQRLVLRLADASAYAACGLRERSMPAIDTMGAVDPRDSTAVRLAGTEEENYRDLHFPKTAPVATAPKRLGADADVNATWSQDELALPIGLDLVTQERFIARITPEEPFIVVGERRTGRTGALATVVWGASALLGAVEPGLLGCVVVAGVARLVDTYLGWGDGLSVWSPSGETSFAERVTDLETKTLVVVDDGERIDDNEGAALVDAARRGGHLLVVASASDATRSLRSWTSALRTARNGIVLGFGRNDAEILRAAPIRFCGIDWQPGRGIAASQCEPTLVQLMVAPMSADSPQEVASTMAGRYDRK